MKQPGEFSTFEPAYLKLEREGTLAIRERELWRIYQKCQLCPRNCGVNRLVGEVNTCKAGDELKISSAGAHFGEEKPLVGHHGSGTIFFSYCNLRCCFCQNWEIAHLGEGQVVSFTHLADIMLDLQRGGCHNINLVTPTHFIPHIVSALRIAIDKGLRLPLVYNTGGFDQLHTIKKLDGIIDIYMPDFKFQDAKLADKYCAGASEYPRVAAAAIQEMHRQVGVLQRDERGIATRGLILRHLVLPNNLAHTDRFLDWVARELSPDTFVNLMDQYRPAHRAFDYPEISRPLTAQQWTQALKWASQSGLLLHHHPSS